MSLRVTVSGGGGDFVLYSGVSAFHCYIVQLVLFLLEHQCKGAGAFHIADTLILKGKILSAVDGDPFDSTRQMALWSAVPAESPFLLLPICHNSLSYCGTAISCFIWSARKGACPDFAQTRPFCRFIQRGIKQAAEAPRRPQASRAPVNPNFDISNMAQSMGRGFESFFSTTNAFGKVYLRSMIPPWITSTVTLR